MAAAIHSPCVLGGLDALELVEPASGAKMKVAFFGGGVFSFVDGSGVERLMLSQKTLTDGSKPVRGGIPLVFPQFGAGPLANHGFARTSRWELAGPPKTAEGQTMADFKLESTDETKKTWPNDFELLHRVKFSGNGFETSLKITNKNVSDAFQFQALLHTYYKVGDCTAVKIKGLKGLQFFNQLTRSEVKEDREMFQFAEETDNIYKNVKGPIQIIDESTKSKIDVNFDFAKSGASAPCDAVCWNPWVDKSKRMDDFGDEEFKVMFCLEPGCVSRFETCEPGETCVLSQQVTFRN